MPVYSITTERRLLVTADCEESAKKVAAMFLVAASHREGFMAGAGHFEIKIFPGGVTACEFERSTTERDHGR